MELEEKIKKILWEFRTKLTKNTDADGMIHIDSIFDNLDDNLPKELITLLTNK